MPSPVCKFVVGINIWPIGIYNSLTCGLVSCWIDLSSNFRSRSSKQQANQLLRKDSIFPSVDYNEIVSDEIKLKIALYNHICNPLKRWKVGHVVPYKLILELCKTFLALAQVC